MLKSIQSKATWMWRQSLPLAHCFSSNHNDKQSIKMNYSVFGEEYDKNNKPLVIMHGLFGSKQNWRGVSRALASKLKRRIYTVDARNHGDSPHTAEHSSELMADDVALFLKDEGIHKATVMGHSMGGRSMMFFALKYPQQLERGIIVDISPISIPRDFFEMENIFIAMKNMNVPPELPMPDGRKIAEQQLKAAVNSQDTVDFIMLNLRKRPTGQYYWTVNLETLHKNLRGFSKFMEHAHHLGPFNGPMMFICGKQSNFVDPESWPEIQNIFPNSEIHWLEAGHLVHFEQPVQFIDLVCKFLK